MSGGVPGCTARENNRDSQRVSDKGSLLNSRIRAREIESTAGCRVNVDRKVPREPQTSRTHLEPAIFGVYDYTNIPRLRSRADSDEVLTQSP